MGEGPSWILGTTRYVDFWDDLISDGNENGGSNKDSTFG